MKKSTSFGWFSAIWKNHRINQQDEEKNGDILDPTEIVCTPEWLLHWTHSMRKGIWKLNFNIYISMAEAHTGHTEPAMQNVSAGCCDRKNKNKTKNSTIQLKKITF